MSSIEPFDVWLKSFSEEISKRKGPSLDKDVIQKLFDKATSGVIAQGKPSYIGKYSFDSSVAYLSYRDNDLLRCPIGHIVSTDQIKKYDIIPSRFIDTLNDELIKELIPNSSLVCARHFLTKLQKAHTDAYISFKKSKEKTNFVADYIANSNVVAKRFGLKELE